MVIPKFIPNVISASCLLGLATWSSVTVADTASIELLNPYTDLYVQWKTANRSGNASYDRTPFFLAANTLGPVGTSLQLFHRQIPILVQDGYVVEFWLKVEEVQQSHNALDAGLAFYAGTTDPSQFAFKGAPRAQLIYFDEDGIGWGDESAHFAVDTTAGFHHYRVAIDNAGTANVWVDGELALQRADFKAYPHLAFGDMTNDDGLNSRYLISSVTVTGLLTQPVEIDVKPSNCPNTLNGQSTKSVPVTIDSDIGFDATRIDPSTVRVNGLAPKGWSIRDASRVHYDLVWLGELDTYSCQGHAGTDGRRDLVVAFEERALVAAMGAPIAGNPTRIRVTGKLKPEFGGGAFAGEDIVTVSNVPAP